MEMLIASMNNAFHSTTQAQKIKDIYDFINDAIAYGGEGIQINDGDAAVHELPGVTITANKGRTWFGRAWQNFKKYINSIEVEGNIVYSVGLQAGAGIETPIGAIGIEANSYSVDIASLKDLINGKNDGDVNYIGKGHWVVIRQGVGIDFIFGGVSVEREMSQPTGGGPFFDKKVTEEVKRLGYYDKKEYYQQGGYQTQSYPTVPTYSNGFKLGFNIQFLLGARIDFEIRRRK